MPRIRIWTLTLGLCAVAGSAPLHAQEDDEDTVTLGSKSKHTLLGWTPDGSAVVLHQNDISKFGTGMGTALFKDLVGKRQKEFCDEDSCPQPGSVAQYRRLGTIRALRLKRSGRKPRGARIQVRQVGGRLHFTLKQRGQATLLGRVRIPTSGNPTLRPRWSRKGALWERKGRAVAVRVRIRYDNQTWVDHLFPFAIGAGAGTGPCHRLKAQTDCIVARIPRSKRASGAKMTAGVAKLMRLLRQSTRAADRKLVLNVCRQTMASYRRIFQKKPRYRSCLK